MKKVKKRQYIQLILRSAVFRLAFIMFAIIVPVCILTLVMSSRAIRMAENQVSDDLLEALQLNMNQLDNYLQNLGRRLYTVSRENEDYARLMVSAPKNTSIDTTANSLADSGAILLEQEAAYASEPTIAKADDTGSAATLRDDELDNEIHLELMHAYLRLENVLSDIRSEYTWADNIMAWFPEQDYFVSSNSLQREESQDAFALAIGEREDESGNWFVLENDHAELFGVFPYRNTYYGASFDLGDLLEKIRLDTSSNVVLFARKQVVSADASEFVVPYIVSGDPAYRELNMDSNTENVTVAGERYLVLTAASEHSDLVLVDLVSRSMLDKTLPGYMRILFMISIIFLACIPLLFFAFGRWLVRPVNILIDAINFVDNGNLDYRIRSKTGTYEFDLLNSNFNEMMDSVKDLKINVYEKELERQEIRLQYLSQQIQPHFILNAMNIIYSYEPEEYPLIQKMVLCLSKYFQFIVNANRPYVKVKHELEHISNYLAIQQIRYGDRLGYRIELDEHAGDAIMPPLMIQNLVENVIKYALRDDAPVEVVVSAQLLDKLEEPALKNILDGVDSKRSKPSLQSESEYIDDTFLHNRAYYKQIKIQREVTGAVPRHADRPDNGGAQGVSAEYAAETPGKPVSTDGLQWIQIDIQDNGRGIKDETLAQIRRFQETKERQEGLGVGIQNTIERMELFFGSSARFEASRWGADEGTVITLTFPAKDDPTYEV